jgi:tetratricopeptide (TPR) repeat protein
MGGRSVRAIATLACLMALAMASAPQARADVADPPKAGGAPQNGTGAAGPAGRAKALELFEQSSTAYERGRFAEAISLLHQSYALNKEPVVLYNLGRAYEGAGDLSAAAKSYEAFLGAEPAASDRGALEQRIATLRRQLAEREALERKAKDVGKAPERRGSVVPWVVGAVGAAGFATGVGVAVLARQRNDQAVSEPTYAGADRLHRQAESMATVANILFVAGGVLLVAGVSWGILQSSSRSSAVVRRASGVLTF